MGKTLFVIRHAKSREADAGQKDIDRILASDGLQQATRLGAYIYNNYAEISRILSSNATRAIQTAEQIADQLNYDIDKIVSDEDLYEASVRIISNKIIEFSNDWNEVIIIGHNPVLSYFVEHITGHYFDGMAEGGMVKISFDVDEWIEASTTNASFEFYVSPDDYAADNQ
jgi:phosphohistidine phosphatase